MALSRLSMLVIIATIFLPSIAMATEYVVGDHHGWATGFNYSAWAADRVFHVGDILVFRYEAGQHNVYKVNGTAFQSCTVPPEGEPLSSGSDTIVLATPGPKWYMCGVGQHCSTGQKLGITVQPNTLPRTPSPSASHALPTLVVPAPAPSPAQHVPHFGRWVPNKKLLKGFHY